MKVSLWVGLTFHNASLILTFLPRLDLIHPASTCRVAVVWAFSGLFERAHNGKATHGMGIPTDRGSFFLAIATLVDLTDTCPNPQHDSQTDCTGFISHESRDGTLSCSNKFPQL